MDPHASSSSSSPFRPSQDAAELSTSPSSSKPESAAPSLGSPELPPAAVSSQDADADRHPKGRRKRTAYVPRPPDPLHAPLSPADTS